MGDSASEWCPGQEDDSSLAVRQSLRVNFSIGTMTLCNSLVGSVSVLEMAGIVADPGQPTVDNYQRPWTLIRLPCPPVLSKREIATKDQVFPDKFSTNLFDCRMSTIVTWARVWHYCRARWL